MNPIIIHIQQANKRCDIRVHQFPDGKNVIDINFSPCFPTEVDSLYEKIAAAVFNEVKKDEEIMI